jgi:hypothetical protein
MGDICFIWWICSVFIVFLLCCIMFFMRYLGSHTVLEYMFNHILHLPTHCAQLRPHLLPQNSSPYKHNRTSLKLLQSILICHANSAYCPIFMLLSPLLLSQSPPIRRPRPYIHPNPPSTSITAPFRYRFLKTISTTSATSSGVPILLAGPISGCNPAVISVSIYPGHIALTLILRCPSSTANDLVRPRMPALEAA